MVAAVRANGLSAWYMVAGDEGHSFDSTEARRWRDGAQVAFIRQVA
ncbi:MAG: hypothetical protein R3C16_08035 [Hyphomonadaceae bacterium]